MTNNVFAWEGGFELAVSKELSEAERQIAGQFVRVFGPPEGGKVLAYLRQITIEVSLPPDASEAQLRDLEGARRLVRRIEQMIKKGNERSVPLPTSP